MASDRDATTRRSFLLGVALAALTGLLYAASFPGIGAWWLAPLVFAPLFFALSGSGPGRAALLGLVTGVVSCGIGFRFVEPVVARFGEIGRAGAIAATVGFVLAASLRFVAQAWLTARLSPKTGSVLAASLAFVASETLVPAPMRWSFAATVHDQPLLTQLAELGGPTLTGLPLVACAACLAQLARDRRVRTAVLSAAPLILSALYGAIRIRAIDSTLRSAPAVAVAIVQGSMPTTRNDVAEARALAGELRLQHEVEEHGAALSIWSESSLPLPLHAERIEAELHDALGTPPGIPTILGAEVDDSWPRARSFNSALLVDGGVVRDRYDKRRLLPFSEYLPLGDAFPVLYDWSPASAHFTPGDRTGPHRLAGHEVGITICYEDAQPGAVNDASGGGDAELLVNLTNDAWFDGSAEPDIHLALAKSRAVEHRRYLVRATNDGLSAIVDPTGRVVASAPRGIASTAFGDVRWRNDRTIYDHLGEGPASLLSWLALLFALAPRKSARQ